MMVLASIKSVQRVNSRRRTENGFLLSMVCMYACICYGRGQERFTSLDLMVNGFVSMVWMDGCRYICMHVDVRTAGLSAPFTMDRTFIIFVRFFI